MCEIDWNLIENSAVLIAAMGDAPCFHDAHVLDSNRTSEGIEVTIHIFRGTQEVDARGHYKLEKHHLVTLRMLGIQESTLPKPMEATFSASSQSAQMVSCENRIRVDHGRLRVVTSAASRWM